MHRNPSHERTNLVEENDEDDDEEETVIELHRSGTGSLSSTKQNGEVARSPSSSAPPSPPRRMSSPNSRFRPPSFDTQRRHASQESNENQSHAIHLGQHETRPASSSSATAPLMNKFQSVLTATTQVVNHFDTVADSVAEAMSLLQHPFGGSSHQQQGPPGQRKAQREREAYSIEPKLQEAREAHTRLKLQAFWQLLLTGFEVLKFAIGKRARKRILWLALDGKLYLTHAKNDKKPSKSIFLADIYKVQKGSEAQSFTKSQSWRDARGSGREQLCFSLHGNCGGGGSRRRQESTTSISGSISGYGEKTFALQVRVASVRNVLVENFDALLKKMKSDADGEFPFVAQKVIAQQFAATGAVLSLYQVEDILLREEDERKSGGVKDSHHSSSSPDKTKGSNGGGLGVIDDDGDSGDDDSDDREDLRDILG